MWCSKSRIYPTKEQEMFLAKQFGGIRFIYNHLLSRSNEVYEKEKRTIHINDLKKEIVLLKSNKSWLNEINSQSLQEAALNLGKSRDRFFKNKSGRPKFKRMSPKRHFQPHGRKNRLNVLQTKVKYNILIPECINEGVPKSACSSIG